MHLKRWGFAVAFVVFTFLVPTRAVAQLSDYDDYDDSIGEHQWIVSGQVGSAFGASAEDATAGVIGTLTYLREGILGAEFLAGFTPDLHLELAPSDNSAVANFMMNGIAALPLGLDESWQPFVSGGLGAMTISNEFLDSDSNDLLNIDDTQLGGNIGFGVMAFGDRWGFRGDVRYVAGFGGDGGGGAVDVIDANDFLSDVDYWRANVGVAYTW